MLSYESEEHLKHDIQSDHNYYELHEHNEVNCREHLHEPTIEIKKLNQYTEPSVQVAKEWFTKYILPRREMENGKYRMLGMGEYTENSELYPVYGSSLRDLTAFGIGIGLYFRMILQLAALMALLSLVSIPNIMYFFSDAYSGSISDRVTDTGAPIDPRIYGSAVCTMHRNEVNVTADNDVDDCTVKLDLMYVDLTVFIILLLYLIASALYQRKVTHDIDLKEQTASDYSVIIKDPDVGDYDPDEWREFFEQFGTVRFVTVAVKNNNLLHLLAQKRRIVEDIRMADTDQTVANDHIHKVTECNHQPEKEISWFKSILQSTFGFYRNLTYLRHELFDVQNKIIEELKNIKLSKNNGYPVWTVFVTFDTEEARVKCLNVLKNGIISAFFDKKNADTPAFKGKNILDVDRAPEPSNIRWLDVGTPWITRARQQMTSLIIMSGMMCCVYFYSLGLKEAFVERGAGTIAERRANLFILAYGLSAADYVGCIVLSYVHLIEQHALKERRQLAFLNKLLLFRCFNGIVVIYLLMDFQDILSTTNLLQIQAILIAKLTTTPILQLMDLYGHFEKWFYGRQAKTQKKLNLYYSGSYWELAYRYTETTKIVGIALFFRPILPTGLIVTSISLIVNYWVDKYSLLRMWKKPPKYDGLLATASRYHMLLITLISFIMMGHWYNGWPYDATSEQILNEENEKHKLSNSSGIFQFVVNVFYFIFPTTARKYLNKDQEEMMQVLCIIIYTVTGFVVCIVPLHRFHKLWYKYMVGGESPSASIYENLLDYLHKFWYESILRREFSSTTSSTKLRYYAYVPSYETWETAFPLLSIPLETFDPKYIYWSGKHKKYCLAQDFINNDLLCKELGDIPLQNIFGICKQYGYIPT